MTDAVGHAAKSQSMVDAITQSAKAGSHVKKTDFERTRGTDENEDGDNQKGESNVKRAQSNERAGDEAPVDKTEKASRKSHHKDDDKKNDFDKSFEATIDKLDDNHAAAGATQNIAVAALPVGWVGQLTLRHANGGSNHTNGPVAQSTADAGAVVLPGKLLKQESIVALLDAKQKLMSAQVAKNAHQDEKIQSTENAASADAQTTSITVQSQEAHWIFDRTGSTSNPRISGSLVEAVSQLKPANPTGATTELVAKGDEKTQAQPGTQIQASAVVAPDDAKLRQAFDGQQQSAGNGRDQAPAGTPGEKHVVDVKTAVPSEHVSPDGSHLPGSLSGATLQVRTGIVNVLKGDSPGAPAATATQLPQDRPAMATQVLRTIDLTLSPPDLGTVRLKLSLTSNALDINAEASKASTAKLLDDDRKGLEQSLRDAGYDVKSVKIAELSASGNSSLNNSLSGGSSFQDGSQTRANFSGRQDGNMQRRDGAMPDQQPQQRQPRDDGRRASTASDLGSGRQSNAIYI